MSAALLELRTAEVNGVPCVLFYPSLVHMGIRMAMRVRPSEVLVQPAGPKLLNAMRLARRRAAR